MVPVLATTSPMWYECDILYLHNLTDHTGESTTTQTHCYFFYMLHSMLKFWLGLLQPRHFIYTDVIYTTKKTLKHLCIRVHTCICTMLIWTNTLCTHSLIHIVIGMYIYTWAPKCLYLQCYFHIRECSLFSGQMRYSYVILINSM